MKIFRYIKSLIHHGFPNVISLVSLIVAFCALNISRHEFKDTHSQALLAMKPSLELVSEEDYDDPPLGISLRNLGPAPSIICSIKYYVDNKIVPDAASVLTTQKLDESQYQIFDFDEGDTLPIGEKYWLFKYEPHGKKNDVKERERFLDLIDGHLGVEVNYRAPLSDICSTKCSAKNMCEENN